MAGRKLSEPWKCPDCGKITRFAFRLADPREFQERGCQGWQDKDQRIVCARHVQITLDTGGQVQIVDSWNNYSTYEATRE